MFVNAFIGKQEKPADNELSEVLGPAKALWDKLVADLAEELKINILEWRSYSIKAGRAARRSGFPKRVAKIIDEARKYAEGTAVRFEVKNTWDVDIVKRLAAIKMDN